MSSDSITIEVSCHCRLFHQVLSLPRSSLPLKSALCSCDSCRHITGQMFATFAVMPFPFPTDPKFFEGLVKYQSTQNLERWFCSRCGASICNYDQSDAEWEFATGAIDALGETKSGEGCLDGKLNRAYLWTHDTIDGGGLVWLNKGKAEGLAGRYWKGRDSEEVTDEMLAAMEKRETEINASDRSEKLHCQCHCGSVRFDLSAADNGEKYGGQLCACTSCRKTSGFEISSGTHVPLGKLTLNTDEPGLGHYTSSKGKHRYFCRKCGAAIMFHADGVQTAAITTGIFDPKAGTRAEAWLKWDPQGDWIWFLDHAIDKEFARKIAAGAQKKAVQK